MKVKALLMERQLGRGKDWHRQSGELRCQLIENQEKIVVLRKVMTSRDDVINVLKRGVVTT